MGGIPEIGPGIPLCGGLQMMGQWVAPGDEVAMGSMVTMVGIDFVWHGAMDVDGKPYRVRRFECLDWPEEYGSVSDLRECASDLADRFSDRPDEVRIWNKGTDFGRTIYQGPPIRKGVER